MKEICFVGDFMVAAVVDRKKEHKKQMAKLKRDIRKFEAWQKQAN